jgi:Lrp/AsnC family transcriptional regulator for asnA, asnC and gidA
MDEKDIEILKELIRNSKTTLAEMAEKLQMSVSTIHKRIAALEKEVIEQYTIILDPRKVGINLIAFLGLTVKKERRRGILEYLKEKHWANEIYELLEPFDLFVKVKVTDIKELKDILQTLSSLEGVDELSSFIVTERYKERNEVL